MGHVPDDGGGSAPFAVKMSARHRERIADDRWAASAAHVRTWLFARQKSPGPPPKILLKKPANPLDLAYIWRYTANVASEMRFPEVKKMLEAKGFVWHRTNGSHHVFTKPGGGSFTLPVHHGKVRPVYVKQIQKL